MQTEKTKLTVTRVLILASVALLSVAIWAARGPLDSAPAWLETIGNFHPLLLHLPIGIFAYVFIMEVIALAGNRAGRNQQKAGVSEALGLTTITAFIAAFCGLALFATGNYSGNLIKYHLWLGIAFVVLMAVMFTFHLWSGTNRKFSLGYRYLLFVVITVMTGTGHYGALITHGNPLKPLFAAKDGPMMSDQKPGLPFEGQPYYEGVIVPILETKCYSCHSTGKKKKSGLLLDSREAMLIGGERGTALVPGATEQSQISRNIHAPVDDDLHMPPDGKPQLVPEEIELIDKWIAAGASLNLRIADAAMEVPLFHWAQSNLAHTGAGETGEIDGAESDMEPAPDLSKVIAEVEKLAANSVHVASSDKKEFSFTALNARQSFGDRELARMSHLLPYLVDIDLSGSQITSQGLMALKGAIRLKRLDLSETAIDDAALPMIAGLKFLEKLNLYGTQITVQSVPSIRQLTNVTSIFLGNTGISGEELEKLKNAMPDKLIVGDILNDDRFK